MRHGGRRVSHAPLATLEGSRDVLLGYLSQGYTLGELAGIRGLPGAAQIARWRREDPDFDRAVRDAFEARAHALVADMLRLAERAGTLRTVEAVQDDEGNTRFVERETLDANKLRQDEIRIRTAQWIASRFAPKDFAERTTAEVTGAGGGAIRLVIGATKRDLEEGAE